MKQNLHFRSGLEGSVFLLCGPGMGGSSHRHDELEVNLVLSGKATYLFGQERVQLVAGSMIWLFPKQEHVLIDGSHDFSLWVAVFKPGFVARYAAQPVRSVLRSADPGRIFCRQLEPGAVDAVNGVYQSAMADEADTEFTNAAMAYALVASWRAFTFSADSVVRTDVHPAVAKAVRLLAGEGEALPLPDLARHAGLSAPLLSRLFKKQTGISITAFRQRQCLDRFLRIYRTGARYSLIEAALLAGFGSYVQFHRVFRRYMNQSPAEFSRAIRKNC